MITQSVVLVTSDSGVPQGRWSLHCKLQSKMVPCPPPPPNTNAGICNYLKALESTWKTALRKCWSFHFPQLYLSYCDSMVANRKHQTPCKICYKAKIKSPCDPSFKSNVSMCFIINMYSCAYCRWPSKSWELTQNLPVIPQVMMVSTTCACTLQHVYTPVAEW